MNSISHNNQRKAAVINDFSGFGRCSIAVALPLISALKVQCCPVPTAVFSNHTGFESFFSRDCTDMIQPYIDEWKKLDLHFEAITSGFLGSQQQVKLVEDFIKAFKTTKTTVVIDPVMGDRGKLYPTYSPKTAEEMKNLVKYADILTPNLTEAAILAEEPYTDSPTEEQLKKLCLKLSQKGGAKKIVITGIEKDNAISNFIYCEDKGFCEVSARKTGLTRSGTGDVFSAIITGCAARGVEFVTSVKIAADFIAKAVKRSAELNIPTTDGICFEELLSELTHLKTSFKNLVLTNTDKKGNLL